MELIESLEHLLSNIVVFLQIILEFASALCVMMGLIKTIELAIKIKLRRRSTNFPFIEARLKFGLWLSIALELQLGADILETTIAPDLEFLARLGVLAAIRTFLNYFLNQELKEEIKIKEKSSLV